MEEKDIELALYVIDLKIAKEIKENGEKSYNKFTDKIKILKSERDEIYKGNTEIINKILTQYIYEVKNK